ncbi:LINE-1 retrotransposable element ORF2 protein [Cucumis melo var. makuwa]|uniref:LINE-1 retrotransposable element ORF2 protein n=1 Tax=Cucumis melo var. makuwa TaxID=1194695 RepID=A0A5D3C3M3_CUCMM|nr:LINE-1 retrotransposable element ORF2 protein [Cucumis melo var. makuwa]
MAYFKSLPRSCKIERKEFVLLLDKYAKHTHYWLTETGAHKAFSIEVSPRDLDWIRSTLKSLIETPSSNRFFLENRDYEHCIWIRKTRNGKGCTAEIFRVDHKNRKSCILVPEGPEKSGRVSFLSMITPKVEVKAKTRPTFLPRSSPEFRLSPPIDYHKRSYEKAVSKGRSSISSDSSDSYTSSDSSQSSGNSPCDSPFPVLLENTVVLALIHFNSNVPANLLCQNKGWTTVEKYMVRKSLFDGLEAISPDLLNTISGSRKSNSREQPSALKSVIIKPARDATSPTTLNEEVVNDNSLHATTIKSELKILSGISNDGSLDKGKQKVDIPSQLTSAFIYDKPKRKVSFNSPSNKTTFFNSDSAPTNHSPPLSSPEKKQRVSRERSVKKKSSTIQPKSRANQGKGELITQPLQVVAHDLDASKKGLSLTVDLGNLPVLDPSKSFEDHHSSDNAEVIDITNTEVVPETPELKMTDPEKSNSSPEVNYRKQKHSHRRRHYYRKKEDKEKDTNSEAFKNQLVTWLKENGLKLSTDTDSSGATTSTNALFSQLGSSISWIVKNAIDSSGGILILWDAQHHSLLRGDLNVVRMREESTAVTSSSHSSNMLNNFISNNLLIDPPLTNNRYTWSNLRNPPTFSRLDRFLYNSRWETLFNPHITRTLSRPTSDHFPLVCEDSTSTLRWGPAPFRLNSIALNDPKFKRNMERWWELSVQNGHPGFSFIRRLKSLANLIKPWQKEKFHSLTSAKENIIREVDSIDKNELDTPLSQEESNRRLALKAELSDLSLKESQFWFQRAKKLWLKEGDENSAFFHRICSSRQKRNLIHEIQDEEGSIQNTNNNISLAFVNHFSSIYRCSTKKDPLFIENLEWNPIDYSDWSLLCAPFLEEEIKGVIKSFDGNKAPGPDGFPISFFKSYWHLLKEDILDIFKDFFEKGIIAKTLSNRLKLTLPDTISGNQLAFIKNRQITDAILRANEALDYWKVKKIKSFILKLDIEKAFDNLNWDFIDFVLKKKNYPNSWRKWIRGCISNVTYSIIVNEKPQDRIKANRGLRQGDPLSPFLFVSAMDYLSRLLSHLESSGAIKGVCLANDCNISHILFADDILLFVEDNDHFLNNLRMALSLFEKASGLKINLSKSAMVPVNVSWSRALECASSWGISCHTLPLTYLGVPLGGNPKSNIFWRNIEDRIQKKLNNWKYAHISKGGRLTLIKSTLSSLSIYQLSVFQAPPSTYKNIEKLWRNFLWKGSFGLKGSHLINWSIVTKLKEEGGLGISRLQVINQALLSKWLWRYYSEPNSLWRRLIHIKYKGKHPGDIPSNISSSSSKAPWKSIINNIDWFKSNQGWDLNNEDQISFWYSNWSPEGCLSTAYPRLFALSIDKKSSIKDVWNSNNNQWEITFRRKLNDRELSTWQNILENLSIPRTNRGPSKPTWIPDSKKFFSIASAKSCISHQPDRSVANPRVKLLDLIWKTHVPMKIKFFMWCLV